MTYASLMVYVDDSPDAEQRIVQARDMAGHFGAVLIGIAACPVIPPLLDPYATGAVIGEVLGLLRENARSAVRRAEALFWKVVNAEPENPVEGRFQWRDGIGMPSEIVAAALCAADVIVLGRRHPSAEAVRALNIGDVLLTFGRPVIIAPPGHGPSPIGTPAVVAWTDSREARQAITAALPMLTAASRVDLLEVCAEDDLVAAQTRLADVAAFLKRHQISATINAVIDDGSPCPDQILDYARQGHAGLIVAGGYGHARLREWVMGGVTQGLLAQSPICVLLSH